MITSLLTDSGMGWLGAGMALPGDYRTLPRVSNSDLTRLKEEQLGGTSGYAAGVFPSAPDGEPNRTFGKAFHQHLLEPESVGTVLEQLLPDLTSDRFRAGSVANDLASLMPAVWQDSFCRRYLRLAEQQSATPVRRAGAQAERERVVLFTDPGTQLPCKARLDLVYSSPQRQQALILDFKSTSARTQAQFLQSCYDYDYDRQAAFYLDSLRYADSGEWDATHRFRFVLIGVARQEPHRLFAVDTTSLPGFVEYGRKKYRFWLKKWQEASALLD